MIKEVAETQYGENADFYDSFFVPERARWAYLQSRINDASEPFGSVLDKALGALSEANESLEHVLDHISFMRTAGNKRVVSDDACKDLVRHFNRYRMRNEDFQYWFQGFCKILNSSQLFESLNVTDNVTEHLFST